MTAKMASSQPSSIHFGCTSSSCGVVELAVDSVSDGSGSGFDWTCTGESGESCAGVVLAGGGGGGGGGALERSAVLVVA